MAQDPTNRPAAPSNEDMGGGNVDKFVQRALPAATRVAQRLDVPVEAVIGQWGLEVGWGKSVIPGTNNLGNIMDFSGKGVEAVDNKLKRKDKYRQYESVDAFADDFSRLLSNPRYKSVPGTKDPQAYFQKLADSGYAEAKDYASTGVKATNMVAKALQRSGASPAVSRETSAPAKRELPPSLPPMAATEESSAAPSKIAGLGPGYQAALALSFLADTDEKEDRDIDREPGVAEKWLSEQAPRPSALASFSDISIKSPFAEPPKMLAHGGEVQGLAGGGLPFVPSARVSASDRKRLEGIKSEFDVYNAQVDAYQKQADAYNAAVEAYNAGPRSEDFTGTQPVAPTTPGTTPEQYAALGKQAQKSAVNRDFALQAFADPDRFGLSVNRLFAEGGEVEGESYPDAGRPTVQETHVAKAMFPDLPVAEAVYILRGGQRQSTPQGEMLMGNLGAQVPLGKDASALLMLAGSRPERSNSESKALMAAFNQRVGDKGGLDVNVVRPLDAPAGIYAGGASASYPLGEGRISGSVNALRLPGQNPQITGYGVGYGGRVGPGNLSAMLMKQKDGPYSGQIEYRLPIGRSDGGEVEKGEAQQALEKYLKSRDEMPDVKITTRLPEGTNGLYTSDNLNIGSGTIKIHKNTPKAALSSLLTHELTHAADRQMRQQAIEQGMFGNSNQYTEAYEKLVGPDGRNRTQFARNLRPEWAAENRLYRADPKEIAAYGVGAFAGPTLQGPGPRHVDATAATELRILMDLAQRNVDKGPTGLEKIPAFFRKMGRYSDGGDVQERLTPQQIERMAEKEAAERENASKPAFLTPKSGKGRQISTKTGELEMAALQGVSEMPYNLLGAPVDLATMAMRPFGYDVEKPMGGSEDLKQRALDAGIRQKPPEGKAARALYELTQATSGAVNPAAPVRGAVKAAEATGEAAKMLARDFQQYNRQLDVPGASYAIKPKGGPFAVEGQTYGSPEDFSKPVNSVDNFINTYLANTNDAPLNDWFRNKVGAYVKRDLGTEADQFVRAADEGRKMHFVQKPITEGYTGPHMPVDIRNLRMTEGFPEEGFAKTPYGQKVEMITDRAVEPIALEDMFPGNVPPSMRQFTESDPTMRVYSLSPMQFDEMRLPELRDKMAKMRQMPSEFSKYGQPAVKVPEQYQLTDKTLQGLTPAQASERVVQFDAWKDQAQQKMASRAAFVDPAISRTPTSEGHVWVNPPDLERNPALRELIQDVGCDGGWCTKGENYALSYGSGENRLTVLMDSKARPRAQMTIRSAEPNSDDFLLSMDDAEAARFHDAYSDMPLYDTKAIMRTPEYQEWLAKNPPSMSITEIKGVNNQANLEDSPYLKQIQQRIKSLDAQFGLQSVDNLDGINMTQMPLSKPPSFNLPSYDPTKLDFSKIREEAVRLNEGSQYVVGGNDKPLKKSTNSMLLGGDPFGPSKTEVLFNQAIENLLKPQQRATGGMIERQSTDTRRYL